MEYTGYASETDYEILELTEFDEVENALKMASRHIDSLTYNRIVTTGFENLMEFQQDLVREVTCRLTEFEHENADVIESALSSYSINGVSMGFSGNSWNMVIQNGVVMPSHLYSMLQQTGLCVRCL